MKFHVAVAIVLLYIVLFPLPVFGAGVVIYEVAWMGTAPKSGETAQAAANNEWIELYNAGASQISLNGWKLVITDEGVSEIFLSGTVAAGGYILLERGNDDVVPGVTADIVYAFKGTALSNTGENLILKNNSGTIVDNVDARNGWPAGDNTTKQTMQRSRETWITAPPTPRLQNASGSPVSHQPVASQTPSPSPSKPSSGATAAPSQSISSPPSFHADAGPDKTAVAGSLVDFFGSATGYKGEPLEGGRYWWNFGDGQTGEGKHVTHLFNLPGTYRTVLHVSNGIDTASDYISVHVIPNQIEITGVVPGEAGFITIKNGAQAELNIGGWVLEDSAGTTFYLPPETRIGQGAEVSFTNRITGMMKAPYFPVIMRYPHGGIAMQYAGASPTPTPTQIVTPKPLASQKPNVGVASAGRPQSTLQPKASLEGSPGPTAQSYAPQESTPSPELADVASGVEDTGGDWLWWMLAFGIGIAGSGIFFAVGRNVHD